MTDATTIFLAKLLLIPSQIIIGVVMYAGLIGSTSSALADMDREKAAQKRVSRIVR